MSFETVSFISDFGTRDGTVGVLHSVLRSLAPAVTAIDITHTVEPFDIREGSLALARAVEHMVPGVVIASVGTSAVDRAPILIEVGNKDSYLLGPDNGLLASAVALVGGATNAFTLDNPEHFLDSAGVRSTCRDIFVPIAAKLCLGEDAVSLGTPIEPGKILPAVLPVSEHVSDKSIRTEVLWVDRFGNIQLNVEPEQIAGWPDTLVISHTGGQKAAKKATSLYELASSEIGIFVDSYGLVSLRMERQAVSEALGVTAGSEVFIEQDNDTSLAQTSSQPVKLVRK